MKVKWFTGCTVYTTLLFAVSTGNVNADWFKQSLDVMGTRVHLELWHENITQAERCRDQVFAEMFRIDELMSPFKTSSEISIINLNAAIRPVTVSSELITLINRSINFSDKSGGAFDITFASIGYFYDYRNQKQPSEQLIKQKLDAINYKKIIIKDQTVSFMEHGMRIDLGGIAKGHAVDQAIKILQQCGIKQALVSAGGDTRILGDKQGQSWMIGIQHPRDENAVALSIPLSDSAISTSGDYERFFMVNENAGEKRVHHIINPDTGTSARKSWSATVIGPDATTTDALSTTVFILGAEEGIKLINSLDDVDAIVIDSSGMVHYSSGLVEPKNASDNSVH